MSTYEKKLAAARMKINTTCNHKIIMSFGPGLPRIRFLPDVAAIMSIINNAVQIGRYLYNNREKITSLLKSIDSKQGLVVCASVLNTSVIAAKVANPNLPDVLIIMSNTMFFTIIATLFLESRVRTGRWFLNLQKPTS